MGCRWGVGGEEEERVNREIYGRNGMVVVHETHERHEKVGSAKIRETRERGDRRSAECEREPREMEEKPLITRITRNTRIRLEAELRENESHGETFSAIGD